MENPYGSALSGETGGLFGGRTPSVGIARRSAAAALCVAMRSSCMFAGRRTPDNGPATTGYVRTSLSVQNRMVSSTASPKAVLETIRSPSRRGSLPAWRGAQARELRTDELWRLLRAHIRCMPLIHFSDTLDLTQRINFDHSFGEASRGFDSNGMRHVQ